MPMASLIPASHDNETGKIGARKLDGWLDDADWKHAKIAFSHALDLEQGGASTKWSNPQTGVQGSFEAVGNAYPGDHGRCRAFHADIDRKSAVRSLQGTACADQAGEWQVMKVKPSKKS
jgi:surface antigen